MADAFEDALTQQQELHDLACNLGAELQRPPSQRDARAIDALWMQIDGKRSSLNSANRRLRKMKRLPRTKLSWQDFQKQRRRLREGKMLTQRLLIWDQMASLIANHKTPKRIELDVQSPPSDREDMLNLLHHALHALANPNGQHEASADLGSFADIPMPIRPFEDMMRTVYRLLLAQGRTGETRFLDVGCGGGSKVLAASLYFSQCDGLDYDHGYVSAGQHALQLTGAERCRIFQADGLTFDGYAEYDVIYFYRPLKADDMLAELEKRVIETARHGTIIAAPYDANLLPREGFPAARLVGPIFVTGYTQDEADALLKEAEQCSTEVITRQKDMHFDPGFWSPILEAASFN